MYRSNAQSRVIESALLQFDIPYRVYGGQRFFERLEIKNALAYMRLILNCHDDVAFERVVNIPPRGIGERTVDAVREHARNISISMWSAAKAMIVDKNLNTRSANALAAFLNLINEMTNTLEALPLSELAENSIEMSGLIAVSYTHLRAHETR